MFYRLLVGVRDRRRVRRGRRQLLPVPLFRHLFDRTPRIRVAVHCRSGLTLLIRNLMVACPRRRLLLYERRASSFRVTICTFS